MLVTAGVEKKNVLSSPIHVTKFVSCGCVSLFSYFSDFGNGATGSIGDAIRREEMLGRARLGAQQRKPPSGVGLHSGSPVGLPSWRAGQNLPLLTHLRCVPLQE